MTDTYICNQTSGKEDAVGTCPTNSSAICFPNNTQFTMPTASGTPVDVTNQRSYGGDDVSWPNLLPINVGTSYDPKTSNTLFLVLAGSYMDGPKYRVSKQGMGGEESKDFIFDYSCNNQSASIKYNTQTAKSGMTYNSIPPPGWNPFDNGSVTSMTATLKFSAKYQDPTINPDNPMVTPGNDLNFKYQTSSSIPYFQFYYGATVPAAVYKDSLDAHPFEGSIGSNSCVVNGNVDCDCGSDFHISFPTPVLDNSTIFASYMGYQTHGQPQQCATFAFDKFGVMAHMRDGLQRPLNPVTNTYTDKCGPFVVSPDNNTIVDGYVKTSIDANNYNSLEYPSNQTCASETQKQNAHYLLESSGSDVASRFMTIGITNANNLYFAETAADDAGNAGALLKSFNIVGRLPGCLTLQETNPTSTPAFATKATEYIKVGATLASSPTSFTFDITKDLKGAGCKYDGQTTNTYNPNDGAVWDSTNSKVSTWPSIQDDQIRDQIPDVVVRIVFYNPDLFHPWDGTTPQLTFDTIQKFQDTSLKLFTQNTPDQNAVCSKLYVHAFERGVAFLEFVSTIAYSLMYAYNLDSPVLQEQYFDIAYHVFVSKGTYAMKDFLTHLYAQLQLKVDSKAKQPMLFDSTDRSSQDEFNSWVNESLVNTDKYMKYPSFRQDGSDLYVQIHMHPMMHANFQSNIDQADWDASLGVYLNNFFQDFASQLAGGKTQLGKTKSVGVLGDITVRKGDDFYAGPTALSMLVQGTAQPSTLDITSSTQTYSVSYMYEAKITRISVGALIYLLQNKFDIDIASVKFPQINVSLPTPMALVDSNVTSCMAQKPITQACIKTLCNSESDCLCDFSASMGKIHLMNPASSTYMNNSNGPCACLASDSYPQGPEISRAKNPVGLCFSKACQDIQLPITDPGFCPDVGCSTLLQTLHQDQKGPNDWFEVFPDHGTGVDLNKLNNMCHTNFVHEGDLQSEKFEINWYMLAGSACIAIAAPLALALDYFGMKQRRTKLVYYIWLGVIVFMLLLSGLLFYSLSGTYKCNSFKYTNMNEAQCVGRFGLLGLTKEACAPHPPLFCQCSQSGADCTDYTPAKGRDIPPECTADGVCALCPNDMTKIDIKKDVAGRIKIPTTWLYLGIGAWFVISGLVCFTLASYFKNLGLTMTQRIGFLSLIGLLILIMGFGCLVAGINRTQTTTFSVDKDSQTEHAKDKDPCD